MNQRMKTFIPPRSLVPALIAGLGLIQAGRVTAQSFRNLHSFTGFHTGGPGGNSPTAGLTLSGNTLFGTASGGGSSIRGTVFKVNTDGTGFMVLHSFTALGGPLYSNSDGANPMAGLVLLGNILYGTASAGGDSGRGTVFAVNTDGTGFTVLHSFTAATHPGIINGDGANPNGALILSGTTLYGTAVSGGSSGYGTVFTVNTNGTGFTTLHSFTNGSDGFSPKAELILSGTTLYGTTLYGGSLGGGTVFAVHTGGTGFTTLHSFEPTSSVSPYANSGGATPYAGLTLSGNTLYGTARDGGSSGIGTVFAINTDGSGFTTLHNFTGSEDGGNPKAGFILSGNTLYGTTGGGGSSNRGTVFAVNTDGTGFKNLYSFTATPGYPPINSDGASPQAGLILSHNTLYGTAYSGGSSGNGTVFSLGLSLPRLTITCPGTNLILTWPAAEAGWTLQSSPSLDSPMVWSPVSPGPTIVNGQNTVTTPVSGSRKFYRLSQ